MKRQVYLWVGVMVAISVLLSMMLSGCGSESISAGLPDRGPQEGIQVHGHWTIDVKNPDGSLVESREFENAITNMGQVALAKFLTRENSVGGWAIYAKNTVQADNPFFDEASPGSNIRCVIHESYEGAPPSGPSEFYTLIVNYLPGGQVGLSGTAIAQRDGSINKVETGIGLSTSDLPPGVYYGAIYDFTSRILDLPVPVIGGQTISITVVISFS